MARPYAAAALSQSNAPDAALVRALQRDLRTLGYLRQGIDGAFGPGTTAAVRALQYDLLNNDGRSRDGGAPVAVRDYRQGRAIAVTGTVDAECAACIDDMLGDARFPRLPAAADAAAENRKAREAIRGMRSPLAPAPFIAAMVEQESGGKHFHEPSATDEDNFVTVGLDRNDASTTDHITSRGYGIGQYTLFHHPPRAAEIAAFVVDPVGNVTHAFAELREKFDGWVNGPTSTADDRMAELGRIALRLCKYPPQDPRHLSDCGACVRAARTTAIRAGDPLYAGASDRWRPTQYYSQCDFPAVVQRADLPCDWAYAMRRYNGSGINSFHYQVRVLINLARLGG